MRSEKAVDIMILGAGASGMMAAVQAARAGASVVIADGNEKAGKKLYATGNGRCNLTNLRCSPADYNSPEDGFAERILRQFRAADTIGFFRDLGMLVREEQEGRCYPYSGQAATVVHYLEQEMQRLGVEFLPGDRAVSAERHDAAQHADDEMERSGISAADGTGLQAERSGISAETVGGQHTEHAAGQGDPIFITTLESGRTVLSRTLIIACGGKTGPAFGSTGDGYGFARAFGHTLQPPRPALVGCLSSDPVVKALRGRARAAVTLYENGREIAREQGEVQFTGMGISGICVMDLTRFMDAPRPAGKKKKKRQPAAAAAANDHRGDAAGSGNGAEKQYEIGIDFAPEMDEQELKLFLTQAAERGQSRQDVLSGILNSHTAEVFAGCWTEPEEAAVLVKDFRVPVESTLGWKEAQVSRGGVRREELQPETMESRLVPGLYFCGEVLDVDGRCGGYNLQWAWASGAVCGRHAAARVLLSVQAAE